MECVGNYGGLVKAIFCEITIATPLEFTLILEQQRQSQDSRTEKTDVILACDRRVLVSDYASNSYVSRTTKDRHSPTPRISGRLLFVNIYFEWDKGL
jgi:hypothetical protein